MLSADIQELPRTGFYVLSVFLLLLVLVKLAIALVRSITADTD